MSHDLCDVANAVLMMDREDKLFTLKLYFYFHSCFTLCDSVTPNQYCVLNSTHLFLFDFTALVVFDLQAF